MADTINRTKLFWRGKQLFLPEYFRVLSARGVTGARQYIALLSAATEGERLVEHERKVIVQLFVPPIPSRPFARYLRSYVDGLILHKSNLHLGTVLIATTSRCQCNCWYCSAHDTPQGEIPVESIEKILDVLKSWGTSIIGFTGGEPMLRNDTDEIIERHSNDFTFMIFSSGYGLDTSRAQSLKEKGLFSIAISLDDYRKTRHDRARGRRGAYATSLNAIENAKKAGIYTIVQCVVTSDLLENGQMWNFLDFVRQTGADELLLLEPLRTGRLMHDNGNACLTLKEHERVRWFHEAAFNHPNLPKVTSFADFENRARFGCGAGIQHAYVDVNGDLWPCNFLPVSLGNLTCEAEIVYQRLKEYFNYPCGECILRTRQKELQKLAKSGLPIPFSKARGLLDSHARTSKANSVPSFYAAFEPKIGQGHD